MALELLYRRVSEGLLREAQSMTKAVVHLINDLERAGAQQMVLSIVRAHDRTRFQPVVIAWGGPDDLMPALAELGVPVVNLGAQRRLSALAFSRLVRELRRIRPAVVHTHLFHMHVIGRVAARVAGAPIVVSTHHNLRSGNHPLMRLAERGTRSLTTATTAVTEAAESTYFGHSAPFSVDLFCEGRRHFTIPNGLAVDHLEEVRRLVDRAAIRAGLGIGGDFVLACVGRLHPSKGHEYLLRAMAEVVRETSGVRLLLVGEGELRPALEAMIEELELGSSVILLGHRSDAVEIVAASDGFVLPSVVEGFGLAVAEAMMLGVPVIATNLDSIQEVVGPYGTLVAPRAPRALAGAIVELINCGPHQPSGGINRVRERFDIRTVVRQYEELYALVLGDLRGA